MTTNVRTERKPRSDMGYFDSVFKSLGPLKFQEINWPRQNYLSVNSAASSFRAAANKRNLKNINVKVSKDRLFVYSDEFTGFLPCDNHVTISRAFKNADWCLKRNPDITSWPIPKELIPTYENLSNFQIAMKIRDDLKAKYPYLTVTTFGKDGYAISRDMSYGNLCADIPEEPVKTDAPSETVETESVADIPETVSVQEDIPDSEMVVIPDLPFNIASDVATYLSSQGYDVSMRIFHDTKDDCYASVRFLTK